MSNEPYMDAILEMILFLELSDPEMVDEDAAVGMMERIADILQKLGIMEKGRFLAYLQRRAAQATNSTQRNAIENLALHFGLLSE